MEHYTRVAVIQTPGVRGLEDKRDVPGDGERASTTCRLEDLTGSLRFLEKLVSGPHDEEFIVVEPGDQLDESRFWELSSA